MKPAPFDYLVPETLTAVLAALTQHGDEAKLLAGGQSLIPAMNFRLARPGVLVDINRLEGELAYIKTTANGGLRLGALTRHYQVERSPLVAQYDPLLQQMMPHIAHPQIRNRGTLGGSLAHADPAAELPVWAIARQATLTIQSERGSRQVAASDFFTGLFATDLAADEMVTEIAVEPLPPRSGTGFVEMARRHGDYALAGVAAIVTLAADGRCAAARLVCLNVGEVPQVAEQAAAMLVGKQPTAVLFAAAADIAARDEIDPTDDIHASAAYKRHLVRVLMQRALVQAFENVRN